MQNFYQLLSLESSASADDIKKAFRAEIARYHPDKVQHLGKEFQEMAATRAAQLTEAYRTLTKPELRAEYDRLVAASGGAPAPAAGPVATHAPARAEAYEPPSPEPSRVSPSPGAPEGAARPPRFAKEHATRDEFVKKATLARIRQVVGELQGDVSGLTLKGFDFDCAMTTKKMFGRGDSQRVAIRFVPLVDRVAVQETWVMAQKAGGQICVLLMGNGMATARELADAISDMRKKSRNVSVVSIVPVDVRDWSAHVPADAPPACKNILQRLRELSA